MVVVGIGVVRCTAPCPRCCSVDLRVLLAEVPVQREVVAEAGDQFAAVELALRAEVAAVERRRDRPVAGLVAAAVVVVLGLLQS